MNVDDRFRAERNQSEESRQRDSNAESLSWRISATFQRRSHEN